MEKGMKRTLATLATLCTVGLGTTSSGAKADNTAESAFKAKCAMCHGADGKGETPTGKSMKVKDFASEDVQKMSDADLSAAISAGKGKMPAYKTLSADQVKALVAYIRTFKK